LLKVTNGFQNDIPVTNGIGKVCCSYAKVEISMLGSSIPSRAAMDMISAMLIFSKDSQSSGESTCRQSRNLDRVLLLEAISLSGDDKLSWLLVCHIISVDRTGFFTFWSRDRLAATFTAEGSLAHRLEEVVIMWDSLRVRRKSPLLMLVLRVIFLVAWRAAVAERVRRFAIALLQEVTGASACDFALSVTIVTLDSLIKSWK
jgi:hypothetical protein